MSAHPISDSYLNDVPVTSSVPFDDAPPSYDSLYTSNAEGPKVNSTSCSSDRTHHVTSSRNGDAAFDSGGSTLERRTTVDFEDSDRPVRDPTLPSTSTFACFFGCIFPVVFAVLFAVGAGKR